MFFSRRVLYTIAAALALVTVAEARCGDRGLPDDCPDVRVISPAVAFIFRGR
ncbi:hypothetical protein DFH06DRAFT_1324171 [Mycena polygramma]|nr:hypothetical protein DFH06DRAFT_1324171 [Mycena polygramma]